MSGRAFFASIVSLLAAFALPTPGWASDEVALAYSPSTGSFGESQPRGTPKEAEDEAMASCRPGAAPAKDCQVATTIERGCQFELGLGNR
jgi:hypothetical protein